MIIIAVLFDLYGTLAGFEPSRFSLQSKVAKKYGYELTEQGVARGYFLADKFMAEQNVTYPIRSQSELEKENFFAKYEKLVLSGDGYDVDIEISGKIFKELQKIPYSMQLYSDVISVLKELRQIGYKLGLISNMNKTGKEILNEFNLVDHIDVCVTSKDALAEKPDPKIFLDTLTLLNVKPNQSVYVGDQILSDIQGSKNVGITPLLIDRDNINIDYSETNKINSLYELNNFLSANNN